MYRSTSYPLNNINQGLLKCCSLDGEWGNLLFYLITLRFGLMKNLHFVLWLTSSFRQVTHFPSQPRSWCKWQDCTVWVYGLVVLADNQVYHTLWTSKEMAPDAPVWAEKSISTNANVCLTQDLQSWRWLGAFSIWFSEVSLVVHYHKTTNASPSNQSMSCVLCHDVVNEYN